MTQEDAVDNANGDKNMSGAERDTTLTPATENDRAREGSRPPARRRFEAARGLLTRYGGTVGVVAAFALVVSVPLAVPGLVAGKDTITFEAVAGGTPGGDRTGASTGEQRGLLGSLAKQLEPTGVVAVKPSGQQGASPFRAVTDRLRPKST